MLRIKRIPGIWQLQNLEQREARKGGKREEGRGGTQIPESKLGAWAAQASRRKRGNLAENEVWDQVGPLRVFPHPVLSLGAVVAGMEADIPVTYGTGSQRAAKTLAVKS